MPSARYAVLVVLSLGLCAARPLLAAGGPGDRMLSHVRILSGEALDGRGNGTPAALAAAESIGAWFDSAGLSLPPGFAGWEMEFPLEGEAVAGSTGVNVLGWLPGAGGLADEVVVLGAHYDHLGPHLDADGRRDGYHPGAEDNASGVAVLIETAQRLPAGDLAPRRSLLVVAFAGEEIGLQGARALLRDWPPEVGRPVAMLNLDSVGRLRDDRLYVGGLGSSPRWRGLLTSAGAGRGLELELSDGGWDASDHVAFNAAGVPVLFFFTGPHPEYHSQEDRWELVDPVGLSRVADFVATIATRVLADPVAFPYATQAELPARPADAARGERAWLGTIPDFVEAVDGVQLAGVMPGSPAEETGLAKGDLVIAVAGETVTGLADLTRILYAHRPGETVDVVVMREGVRRSHRATLRERRR